MTEKMSAIWTQLRVSDELTRSSHTLSVVDDAAYIFGGELLPRQPRDNDVYKIEITAGSMLVSAFFECLQGPNH